MSHRSRFFQALVPSTAVLALALLWPRSAEAQIKQPGAHPRYSVELEPHLLVQHDREWFADDEGFGPGLRASIPIMHNGPIPKINNSLAIGFGIDWAMFDGCDGWGRDDYCDADFIWFPVVGQWNFFFTPVISVFGELGFSIMHRSVEFDGLCLDDDDCTDDDLRLFEPVFFAGGRFMFSDSIGLVVRIGTPYVSVGPTFLL